MTQITVPDDVARLIVGATAPIVLVDSKGRTVGRLAPLNGNNEQLDPDVALALKRMDDAKLGGKFYTTEEVVGRLRVPE